MPENYPPPEEAERERRRLDAIRPWHRAGWVLVGVGLVLAFAYVIREALGAGT